jgi:hypothetical protein
MIMAGMQPYKFEINNDEPDAPNIVVEAEGADVKIVINGYKMFNTLANREIIILGLNDKLKELVEKHLQTKAYQESEMRKTGFDTNGETDNSNKKKAGNPHKNR